MVYYSYLLKRISLIQERILYAEREGTGSNYLGDKANWVMICCLVEKILPN